jgi:Protein of unknown function (DUF669)
MAINFSNLPTKNPFALPEPGVYRAIIEEAEMRNNKTDATKPPYLNLKYKLLNEDESSAGTMYDLISESDSSIVQFKISRFIQACGLPLTGSMELKDLAKIAKGRTIVVDVAHDKKSNPPRAQVDLFSRQAYYPAAEYAEIKALVTNTTTAKEVTANDSFMQVPETEAEAVFNAPDGGAPTTPADY